MGDSVQKKSILHPFENSKFSIFLAAIILAIFVMMIIQMYFSGYGNSAIKDIKRDTAGTTLGHLGTTIDRAGRHLGSSLGHLGGNILDATSAATGAAGAALNKDNFASAEVNGSMWPYISPAAWGNGALPAMMIGSGLNDSIATGQSWNPPNLGGCDCNGPGVFNSIYTSSMPTLSADEIALSSGKNAATSAKDQAAFYAAMNGGNLESDLTDFGKLSDTSKNEFSGMF